MPYIYDKTHNRTRQALYVYVYISLYSLYNYTEANRDFSHSLSTGSSGRISFPNLKPGLYVLKVQAFNRKTDVTTVKRGFEINSDPNYCSLVLVNRGVTVSGDSSSAEVEVQLYGPATQLSCVLDKGMAFTCKQKSRVRTIVPC